MNTQVTIFSRIAGYAVNKTLAPKNRKQHADKAELLLNNMNLINKALVTIAVKLINKNKSREDINQEELAAVFHDIIHLSVVSYAKRAH